MARASYGMGGGAARPGLTCLVPLAAACAMPIGTTSGPSFGGRRAAHALQRLVVGGEAEGAVTEVGVLAVWPVAVDRAACRAGPCLDARTAWLPDDGLPVAIGLNAVGERDPMDLAFALDGSGSLSGFEDARAASVVVALERPTPADRLVVWAFTPVSEELVASEPVADAYRAEMRSRRSTGSRWWESSRGMQPDASSDTFDDPSVGAGSMDSVDNGDLGPGPTSDRGRGSFVKGLTRSATWWPSHRTNTWGDRALALV